MVAFALHRVIVPTDEWRVWPGALARRNTFNAPLGDHILGWGRQLFCYGFDEYFLKTVPYFMSTSDGSGLYSPIPAPSFDPAEIGAEVPDDLFLRCRSAWFLDALWLATHSANVVDYLPTKHSRTPVDLEPLKNMARECGLVQ
jgi:hypothetical protein|tara:strand:+ start:805 stop:1233 length:429 start_codon:yes stop_codon:yes gene_type:complete